MTLALSHERKYAGPAADVHFLVALFDHLLAPDGEFPVNTINSIYFDTPALRSYAEKADGDNLKRKVRLRWYSAQPGAPAYGKTKAFVEIKFRNGSARSKIRQSAELDRGWLESVRLDDPALGGILHSVPEPQLALLDPEILPAVCITYDRRRYRCPFTGARVAVDFNIRAHRFHPALFPLGTPVDITQCVCEIKDAKRGADELGEGVVAEPPWTQHLFSAGFRLRSFSKFGESVRILLLGNAKGNAL